MSHKYVYLFSEGNGHMRELLGGKGANLAEMTNLGMPVPQGFTITTEACTQYYKDDRQINSEIEAEMDRRNMEKDSYNPLTHRPANHLRSKPGYAETIAVFYPKQSVRQINACIHSIRICCNLFVIPNLQMRSLILKLLKLVHFPKVIREMIIKCRKNPDCEPICRELDQLYAQAVPLAVELIQNFDEVLKGTGVFDSRLQHTFGEF